MKPHIVLANRYVRDVLAVRINVCRWVRLACQRHLDDIEAAKNPDYPYEFNADKADRVCRFVERFPHTKGQWAAKHEPFVLQPWQAFWICSVFGWERRKDKLRRFRKCLILVPRKSGKSDLAARIGLWMLASDGEMGAEVYSGATSEKQAWEVFRPALLMTKAMPQFQAAQGVMTFKQSIAIPSKASRFEPLIGKPGDGASPSCAIVDEYHEHTDDALAQTMLTGMGARQQPLILYVSTAGENTAGPCYQMMLEAQRMLDGLVQDDELFALTYGLDETDDWTDPAMLRKANPNYGISVSGDFLLARHADAMANARQQGVYQIKHLNRWVGAKAPFFDLPKWLACKRDIVPKTFHGRRAWLGLDLASTIDINALVLLLREGDQYTAFGRLYLPEAELEKSSNKHLQAWHRQGRLIVTPGEIVDMEWIRDDILELARQFQILDLGYDPFQATMLVSQLMKQGIKCVEVRPTVLNFSQPMKQLDGLIRSGKIEHDGCPVMTWMIGNVTAHRDAKDNVYPRKARDENKIDGVVALLMALARASVEEAPVVSVYEQMARAGVQEPASEAKPLSRYERMVGMEEYADEDF